MVKKFDRALLLDCATEVLDYLALQEPLYAERIEITKSEYNLDNLQVLMTYAARTLELAEHMVYSEREFLQPNYIGHRGPKNCAICGLEFLPTRGTDEICQAQACLDRQAELLDAEFAKAQSK